MTISVAAVPAARARTGKNRGGSVGDAVRRAARGRERPCPALALVGTADEAACRNSDAAQQSVDALNPLLLAKSSAESPLSRPRTRSTHFASVSFVMQGNLPPDRVPRKNAFLCSGYAKDAEDRLGSVIGPEDARSVLYGNDSCGRTWEFTSSGQ